ncbi:uncharacterized protein LOC143996625 [Lithobates pipiens]
MSSRAMNTREVVDNEALIRHIRARKCLYDKKDPAYKDHVKRDHAWVEICRLFFPDWDLLSETDRSEKLTVLQTRWKGLRDCFKRHLRRLHEGRSGSGSRRFVPYVHAEELQFLLPFMEPRETQSSWGEGQQSRREASSQPLHEAASAGANLDVPVHEPLEAADEIFLPPSPQHDLQIASSQQVELQQVSQLDLPNVEQPQVEQSPNQRAPLLRSSRPVGGSRGAQTMERFANLMDRLDRKLETLETEESAFGVMVASMRKRVPDGRKNLVRKDIMDILEANMITPNSTNQSVMLPNPPCPPGPYYNMPNPPPPRTHPYYPPRFRPYTDEYGNALTSANAPIPYPSPSPIFSSHDVPNNPILMPSTPSPMPSTSSNLTYHQL